MENNIEKMRNEIKNMIGKNIVILNNPKRNKDKVNQKKYVVEGITEHYVILKREIRNGLHIIETINFNVIIAENINLTLEN